MILTYCMFVCAGTRDSETMNETCTAVYPFIEGNRIVLLGNQCLCMKKFEVQRKKASGQTTEISNHSVQSDE